MACARIQLAGWGTYAESPPSGGTSLGLGLGLGLGIGLGLE